MSEAGAGRGWHLFALGLRVDPKQGLLSFFTTPSHWACIGRALPQQKLYSAAIPCSLVGDGWLSEAGEGASNVADGDLPSPLPALTLNQVLKHKGAFQGQQGRVGAQPLVSLGSGRSGGLWE